jgi:hypothetical protein
LDALHLLRGKAGDLINELSGETGRQMKKRAKARIEKVQLPDGSPIELLQSRKKRRLSAATKIKIRASATGR